MPNGQASIIGFDFPATPALGTADHSETVREAFLLTHIVGFTDAALGSFLLQIYHQHGTVQRQLLVKDMQLEVVAGAGVNPFILPSPYLVGPGDTLTVSISSVGQNGGGAYAPSNIQVVLFGVHPEAA